MKKYIAGILCLTSFLLFSCSNYGLYQFLLSEDTVDERSSKLTIIPPPDFSQQTPAISSTYSVLVISDVHFGSQKLRHDIEFCAAFRNLLSNSDSTLIPRFVISLGDSADGGHQSEYYQYDLFLSELRKIAKEEIGDPDYKIYTVLGNHDLYNNGWSKWKHLVYPFTSSYFFSFKADSTSEKGFTYYFLDSANGTLGVDQLESFEKITKNDTQNKFVMTHYPLYCSGLTMFTMQDTMERNKLLSIFAKRDVKALFGGHAHMNYSFDYGNFKEFLTGSEVMSRQYRLFTVNEKEGTVTSVELSY